MAVRFFLNLHFRTFHFLGPKKAVSLA